MGLSRSRHDRGRDPASHRPIAHRIRPLPELGGNPRAHLRPEITDAIIYAAKVFRQDVGRYPTPTEVLAGLLLVDTEAALLSYVANDIRVGDRVMWAERDDNGQFLHQTLDGRDDMIVPAYGTVVAQPDGWDGDNTVTRDDGRTVIIGRKWLIKVPS